MITFISNQLLIANYVSVFVSLIVFEIERKTTFCCLRLRRIISQQQECEGDSHLNTFTCLLSGLQRAAVASAESCRSTFSVTLRHSERGTAEPERQMCLSGVGRNNNRVKTQAGLLNVVHFVQKNNCK